MFATKRIALTEPVWAKLSDLRRPGETFNQLITEMIEREKKARLIEHLKQIADEGNFVELPPLSHRVWTDEAKTWSCGQSHII